MCCRSVDSSGDEPAVMVVWRASIEMASLMGWGMVAAAGASNGVYRAVSMCSNNPENSPPRPV